MIIVVVLWIECFITLSLRWLVENERLEQTIRSVSPDSHRGRDEMTDLLLRDPGEFARTAPRQWAEGVGTRLQPSPAPAVERRRGGSNRSFAALVVYIFIGTPVLGMLAIAAARTSWVLLVGSTGLIQVILFGYWTNRMIRARRSEEDFDFWVAVSGLTATGAATAIILMLVAGQQLQ